MPPSFTAQSTADDVLQGRRLHGQHVLLTGASSGIGTETARALVAHGAHVIGTARNIAQAEKNNGVVQRAAARSGGSFELIELDLTSLASVRHCAAALLARGRPLDVVIANAGVMAAPFRLTEDGFESQMATNHLGHFILVNRLVPLMHDGSRVVIVASSGHRFANVDLDDPHFSTTPYDPFVAYGRSKTASILFAVEFDRRHRARGIRATAVHPGAIPTALGRHLPEGGFDRMVDATNAVRESQGKSPFIPKTIPQGAATSVWAAVVASADEIGGRYCENAHVTTQVTDEALEPGTEGVRPYAVDPQQAMALWAASEDWVGEQFSS